jgi:SpoIIAA-like
VFSLAEPKRPIATLFVPMVKLFYQDEYATIELDESIPCVRLKLDGLPRYSEHYQFVQMKRLELMHKAIKNHKLLHMLTDSRTAGPVLSEDVSYFKQKVMPQMELAGIRFLAIVMPSSLFTRMTIQEMTDNSGQIEVRYFDSLRDAREWLKNKSPELL